MAITTPSARIGKAMWRASWTALVVLDDVCVTTATARLTTPAFPRILALDLGKRRIGLAISDPLGITAQGLPNLVRTRIRTDLDVLEQLIRQREVGLTLLGTPINRRGTEARQSVWVREFAESLEKRPRLPVKLWDERLTSVEAGRVLRSSGISIEKRAAAVDRLSAVILLQSYLDAVAFEAAR